ncbi:hypothetical protein PENTCL1PPCAC_22736, partial [Pristionchus entomophagus]
LCRMSGLERTLLSSTRNIIRVFSGHLPSRERSLVSDKIQSLIDYNIGDGKHKRAQLVISSFDAVGGQNEKRDTAIKSAAAIEMMQSFLLIADDIMDNSETRRGKVCWHRKEGIGLSAVNDVLLLHCATENEIREAFRGHPNENLALSALRSTIRKTIVGQMLDTASAGKIEEFNWERYSQLVEHKTSHYTFVLPLTLGLLAGEMKTSMDKVMETALKIGYIFQSQDDWLDVYGSSALTGKFGSDIKDQKCTWLSCKALEILRKKEDSKMDHSRFKCAFTAGDEDEVRRIYESLQLSQRFKTFEDEYSSVLLKEIQSIPHRELSSLLTRIITESRHRQK